MAYMNQEKKTQIAAKLKAIMPKGWKYSLSVSNHSTIVCTITAAPVDIVNGVDWYEGKARPCYDVNPYHFERNITDADLRATVTAIMGALNLDNYNDSDPMSDYYNVGHYVKCQFGRWDKPFTNTAA
jgi:hypothetical protein